MKSAAIAQGPLTVQEASHGAGKGHKQDQLFGALLGDAAQDAAGPRSAEHPVQVPSRSRRMVAAGNGSSHPAAASLNGGTRRAISADASGARASLAEFAIGDRLGHPAAASPDGRTRHAGLAEKGDRSAQMSAGVAVTGNVLLAATAGTGVADGEAAPLSLRQPDLRQTFEEGEAEALGQGEPGDSAVAGEAKARPAGRGDSHHATAPLLSVLHRALSGKETEPSRPDIASESEEAAGATGIAPQPRGGGDDEAPLEAEPAEKAEDKSTSTVPIHVAAPLPPILTQPLMRLGNGDAPEVGHERGEGASATAESHAEPQPSAGEASRADDAASGVLPFASRGTVARHVEAGPGQRAAEPVKRGTEEAAPQGAELAARSAAPGVQAATAILKAQLQAAAAPLAAAAALPAGMKGAAVEIHDSGTANRPAATGRVRDAAASLGLFASQRLERAEAPARLSDITSRGAAAKSGSRDEAPRPAVGPDRSVAAPDDSGKAAAAPVAPADFARFVAADLRAQAPVPGGASVSGPLAAPAQPQAGQALPVQASMNQAGTVRQLDVQLHPAELGAVTARIRMSGSSIAVDIAAETPEARARLAEEGDKIRAALEALGFSVDTLSIRLPDAAAPKAADAPGRDPQGQGPTGSGAQAGESGRGESGGRNGAAGGSGTGGGRTGGDRGEADARTRRGETGGLVDRAGGAGVYI